MSQCTIPTKWPTFFNRLGKLFFQINTHLTFLSSHSRNIIPSFELLQKLNDSIQEIDLVIIKLIYPEIFFDYVDENQVALSFIEDVKVDPYKGYHQTPIANLPDDEHSKQILIFDFQDAKLHSIAGAIKKPTKRRKLESESRDFFLSSSAYNLTPLSHDQLVNLINSRNTKFIELINKYVETQGSYAIAEEKLLDLANSNIPQLPHLTDIVQDVQSTTKERPTTNSVISSNQMIQGLKDSPIYQDQISSIQTLDHAKPPQYKQLSPETSELIHPNLKSGLISARGLNLDTDLYNHQATAIENLFNKSNVIVSTPTASGKSLIYQIPILNSILWDIQSSSKKTSTAFFIFPTKALAQDQLRHLQDFIKYISVNRQIVINTYDGDTPFNERQQIIQNSDIIFTNPDTIHASILPKNQISPWREFLKQLKFVVMDELHVYRGTFGINVSFVMSRLQRIKSILSDDPIQFVSCSATIENPISHFRAVCALTKEDNIVHVSEDGSPHCEKKLIIWNPPLLMNKRGNKPDNNSDVNAPRVGMIAESAKVLLSLLVAFPSIKAIVFCPIRVVCEMLMKEIRYLLENNRKSFPLDQEDILAYRGGYNKSDRRIIERKMFDGQLRAIIATNALELGIDLSDLDAVLCCGFPMSKSNLHQQFGRAGRGDRGDNGSLAIFIPGRNPLDQYYLDNPHELIDRNYEELCVSGLRNMESSSLILERNLQCAAYEYPIDLDQDFKWFLPGGSFKLYSQIVNTNLVLDNDGKYKPHPRYSPKPHNLVQIRAIEETQFAIVDVTNNRNIIIEELEASRICFTVYEGGIFLHQGQQYLVKEFDFQQHYAKVERVNVDWTTSQRDFTDVDPEEVEFVKPLCPKREQQKPLDIPVFYGKIKITMKVFGFFKVNRREEIIEAVEVKNPPVIIHSKGVWINVSTNVLKILQEKNLSAAGAIHATEHAIMNMLAVFINGSSSTTASIGMELATECKAPTKEFSGRETSRKRPARLIFYDTKGGKLGSGISYKTFECIDQIINATFNRIKACSCQWGCPLCIISSDCREQMQVISKPGSILILGSLLGLDLSILQQEVPDGPELNMPDVNPDTIVDSATSTVKFSPNVKIITKNMS
ncbi:ATP-dependent helicase HRQ1 [Spathaspora sp. JA1]|nr:ATP-dependent helicase HRQ1 [Spathaspora sp. JA1]